MDLEKRADETIERMYNAGKEMFRGIIEDAGRSLSKTAYLLGTNPDHVLGLADEYHLTHLFKREKS